MKIYKNSANHQVSIVEMQRFSYLPYTIMPYGKGWQYNIDITESEDRLPNGQSIKVYFATSFIVAKKMDREELINAFIRCLYTIDDEFAIQRQRDTKPERFVEYNKKIQQILEISDAISKQFQNK